jgi:hypothetical protein
MRILSQIATFTQEKHRARKKNNLALQNKQADIAVGLCGKPKQLSA